MTTRTPALASASSVSSYLQLRAKVRETLLEGQQRIERARVETYWITGKHLHEHILQNKDRAEYGKQVIGRLAADLGLGDELLYRVMRFYQAFPISSTWRKLSWSHLRELMKIEDKQTRLSLLDRAEKSEWTARELAAKIHLETAGKSSNGKAKSKAPQARLIPKLGELYTYRLVREEGALQEDKFLRVDLGFDIRTWLLKEESRGLKENQIIETVRDQNGNYSYRPSRLDEAALFTYKARVLRVIDGDTIFCLIDLGFKIEQRHYLRFRGINCPEIKTAEGKRAKSFIEKKLEAVPEIILTSSKSDKYGRYLADVFLCEAPTVKREAKKKHGEALFSKGEAKMPAQSFLPSRDTLHASLYLNQALLDHGLAERMG